MDTINVPLPASLTGAILAPSSPVPAASVPVVRQPAWEPSPVGTSLMAPKADAFVPVSSAVSPTQVPLLPGLDTTMEPVSGFMNHQTHELYLPASVMGELTQHGTRPNPFQQVDYSDTAPKKADAKQSSEPAEVASEEHSTSSSPSGKLKKPVDDAELSGDTIAEETVADTPKAAESATKTPAELTEEQKAVAEFMQAYQALKESISDPEVSDAISRMRDRMLHPWSINPFQFLKDLNTIRKDDSVKKFLKETKDLGPYWDKLQAALPEASETTGGAKADAAVTSKSMDSSMEAASSADVDLGADDLTTIKPAPHRHRHPGVGRDPTIIPVSDLPPELLEALMQEG